MAAKELHLVDYGLDPSALILGRHRWGLADAVSASGFRVLGEVPAGEGLARLDLQADADLVLLHVQDEPDDQMDRLVARVAEGARAGRFQAVIVLAPGAIDAVFARIDGDEAALLVDPAPADLALALAMATRPRDQAMLHDVGTDGGSLRLVELSEEVGRLARKLAALAGESGRAPPVPEPAIPDMAGIAAPPAVRAQQPIDAVAIRAMIRARRLRDQFFRSDLFADPAWDILLDLAAARKEGRPVPVSSLCIAAAVPPTTALRWIRSLTDDGVLVRHADPHDGRRIFVTLSEDAARRMDDCVFAMRRVAIA